MVSSASFLELILREVSRLQNASALKDTLAKIVVSQKRHGSATLPKIHVTGNCSKSVTTSGVSSTHFRSTMSLTSLRPGSILSKMLLTLSSSKSPTTQPMEQLRIFCLWNGLKRGGWHRSKTKLSGCYCHISWMKAVKMAGMLTPT